MIDQLRIQIPIAFLCRHFGLSRSGFYSWKQSRDKSEFGSKAWILIKISEFFKASKGTYGAPRIFQDLNDLGIKINIKTVAKYMRSLGLSARLKRKFKVLTTNSNHDGPIAPRVFKSEEDPPKIPRKILAGDITYLPMGDEHVYLAIVMDLYNREILGWSISKSLSSKIVVDALNAASLKGDSDSKIIFHSDRGSQYASEVFRSLLDENNFLPSMSRKGNCYDNCFVESWFASLKKEWIYKNKYQIESELRALVFEYIEIWYNRKRRHSSLDYMSPVNYKIRNLPA